IRRAAGAPQLGTRRGHGPRDRGGAVAARGHPSPELWDIEQPAEFDRRAAGASLDDIRGSVFVSAEPAAHLEHLLGLAELGFDALYLHHVGREQDEFLTTFGREVLPGLKGAR